MATIPDKDAKCLRILTHIESGMGVTESCREEGISEKTYYRWKHARAEARQA